VDKEARKSLKKWSRSSFVEIMGYLWPKAPPTTEKGRNAIKVPPPPPLLSFLPSPNATGTLRCPRDLLSRGLLSVCLGQFHQTIWKFFFFKS
jgi:hypothetical protein